MFTRFWLLNSGCSLDYPYLTEQDDSNKQKGFDTDLKTIQQINYTGNLDPPGNMFFIVKEAKETILDFPLGTVRVIFLL